MNDLLNKPDVLLWFKETWARFWTKTPKYFRTLGNINVIAAILGAVPKMIEELHVAIPPTWLTIIGYMVSAAGLWARLNNKLVISNPVPDKMPYTEKKEMQKVIEKVSKSNQS